MSAVRFKCVFCGGTCEAFDDSVIHTVPICETFDRLDVLEFMEETNNRIHGKEKAERMRREKDQEKPEESDA